MENFCTNAKEIIRLIGWVVFIFKIIIPLIVIVLGAFDLGKAVMSGKDDDIKKNAKTLGVRVIAGVIVFILPSIILWAFEAFTSFGGMKDTIDFEVCKECLLSPGSCK